MSSKKLLRHGFTLIELITITIVIGILAAFATVRIMNWHKQVVRARNVANVQALVLATTRFQLEGGTFTDLTVDEHNEVDVAPIVAQLIAANKLAPMAAAANKLTSRQITVRYFPDSTNPSAGVVDTATGALFFWSTNKD